MARERLCLVMPVFNEARRMEGVCQDWLKAAGALDADVTMIVVDDGSTDGTSAVLDRLAPGAPPLRVIHQPNAGHGAAICAGYNAAISERFDWIFQTDSDGQSSAD